MTVVDAPIARCFDLARSVEVHLAGNVHWGEQARAIAGVTSGLLEQGQQVTWQAKHFGVRFALSSEIRNMKKPIYFQDVMLRGPFQRVIHDHYFRILPNGGTEMRDVFLFGAPLGLLGRVIDQVVLGRYMLKLLRERTRVIKEIAESNEWERYVCGS